LCGILRCRIRDEQGRKIGVEVVGPWPEPPLPPLFCTRRQVLTHWGEDGRPLKEGRLTEEVVFDDLGILEAYRAARDPVATEGKVPPLRLTPEEVRRLTVQLTMHDC
jgi:hypothetical protein